MSSTNASLPLKQWTVDEYHRLLAAGILTDRDRVELLDGDTVEMVPPNPRHASIVDSGGDYLKLLFAGQAKVGVQLPITITPDSELEPDFAIVCTDDNRYRYRHPTPEDIFCLIEVADATVLRDRTYKAEMYARANIREYWIVNINQQQINVLRHPTSIGYEIEQQFSASDSISPQTFPQTIICLSHLMAN